MKAVIVIPCVQLTPRLEEAVYSASSRAANECQIVVVVDGGGSGLHEVRDDGVLVIGTDRQGGFATACNAGVMRILSNSFPENAIAKSALVFLNDDAVLPDSWVCDLGVLVDSRVGAIGWKVRGPNGDRKGYPTEPWGESDEHGASVNPMFHLGPTLSGCAFAVRADRWIATSGLDQRFGMYGEETDLFMTLQAAGLVLVECDSVVWHEGEGSMSSRRTKSNWYGIRNPIWVAVLHSSTRKILRTILVTVADTLSFSRLPPDAEAHRRRRRTAAWPARFVLLFVALLQTLLMLPMLLKARKVRKIRVNQLRG